MKNGIICKEDGELLLEIYRAINVWDGTLNRPLTTSEMVLIFSLGHIIKDGAAEKDGKIIDARKVVDELRKIEDIANDKIIASRYPQYYDDFSDGIDKAIQIVEGGKN